MYTHELLDSEILEKELIALIDVAHLLGLDKSLVLPGSTSVSAKLDTTDLSGQLERLLFMSGKDEKLAEITANGFPSFLCRRLMELVEFDEINSSSLEYELGICRLPGSALMRGADLFLHAVIPSKYVFFTQPIILTAISSTDHGRSTLEEIYRETLIVLPYTQSGLPLAKSILQEYRSTADARLQGFFILNQGLVSFGDTPQEAFEKINKINEQALQYIKDRNSLKISFSCPHLDNKIPRQELAELRKGLSKKARSPLILKTWRDPASLDFIQLDNSIEPAAPALPAHLPGYQYLPLFGRNVESYKTIPTNVSFEKDAFEYFESSDSSPRIVLDPALGLCSAGGTVHEALANAEYFTHSMQVFHQSISLGSYTPLTFKNFIEEKGVDSWMSSRMGKSSPFRGEIALVTGAASGIGKACASSLLARGAAVVGLDISNTITGLFPSRNFFGLVCDIADEDAIQNAIDQTALAFGGLDMLVLNAGIFPSGCRIDAMQMDEWEKVMRINLHGNMALMRETYPLLKLAPRYGRVVINGSRNVKAPGPGASAYSASKAALTQLARVAALEWGKDGIRVNIVHPNAVFDTALYTEDVLKARATSYGITVEQYKKNNVLSVEITSHDVAEMVAEMCGPIFEKVTGVQLSIDGGSDRVI